jgi:hypothetical protein
MRRQGFKGTPSLMLESFDAQQITRAFEYLSKNATGDEMSVVIDPFSRVIASDDLFATPREQCAVA